LVKDSLAQLQADKKAKAAAASATDPKPPSWPVSPPTFPLPTAPQLPPTEGAQHTAGESVDPASIPLPESPHSSSPEPPLIDLSDTGGTGMEDTCCINRAGAPESSVVTELCSVSPTRVTIAGSDPAKFWKHLCQQAWDDGDVEKAKVKRVEIAASPVYQAGGAAGEWEPFQRGVIKELRSTCMQRGLGSPYAPSLLRSILTAELTPRDCKGIAQATLTRAQSREQGLGPTDPEQESGLSPPPAR